MIIRISEVKMQKSDINQQAATVRRKTRPSTTLNRKYVKRPSKSGDVMVSVKRSPQVRHFSSTEVATKKVQDNTPVAPAKAHPMQAAAISKMQKRTASMPVSRMTAKELKDQAIKKALADASRSMNEKKMAEKVRKSEKEKSTRMHFGLGRIVLALSCAAAAVFAIVYFVNLNMPDISIRVAAIQTGIEASYPSYVPRDFSLSNIASEDGKVTLSFKSNETGDEFLLIEEQSSWDSNALLANFVKDEYGENYSIVREQGLTIYMGEDGAAWVNGGMVYKLNAATGLLTKKQICSIAVSL